MDGLAVINLTFKIVLYILPAVTGTTIVFFEKFTSSVIKIYFFEKNTLFDYNYTKR